MSVVPKLEIPWGLGGGGAQFFLNKPIRICIRNNTNHRYINTLKTSESKNYFFEIKPVRLTCQQKVQKQEFCDSVRYKIPNFTD